MSYKIIFSDKFQKSYDKLDKNIQNVFKSKLLLMSENPMHPSLRSKRIRSTRKLFEFSVNMDIRVIWRYNGSEIILLVNIGHHDIIDNIKNQLDLYED